MPTKAALRATSSRWTRKASEAKAPKPVTKARSRKPGATKRGAAARWPRRWARAYPSARRSAPGWKSTSPSVNRIHSPRARRPPTSSAWFLPSQPEGSAVTWTTVRRESEAASRSRMAPVASLDRSSTATTCSAGSSCASRERTVASTSRASSRQGTTTETAGGAGSGDRSWRSGMARSARQASQATPSHPTRASVASARRRPGIGRL